MPTEMQIACWLGLFTCTGTCRVWCCHSHSSVCCVANCPWNGTTVTKRSCCFTAVRHPLVLAPGHCWRQNCCSPSCCCRAMLRAGLALGLASSNMNLLQHTPLVESLKAVGFLPAAGPLQHVVRVATQPLLWRCGACLENDMNALLQNTRLTDWKQSTAFSGMHLWSGPPP